MGHEERSVGDPSLPRARGRAPTAPRDRVEVVGRRGPGHSPAASVRKWAIVPPWTPRVTKRVAEIGAFPRAEGAAPPEP